jgi:hypothetical protein
MERIDSVKKKPSTRWATAALLTLVALVALVALAALWTGRRQPPATRSYKGDTEAVRELYKLEFPLTQQPMGTVGLYLPRYISLEASRAQGYAGPFGLDTPQETEDAYRYEGPKGTLEIFKDISLIRYTAAQASPTPAAVPPLPLTDPEAVALAVGYVESKFLFLNYSEVVVNFDTRRYEIQFIDRVANLRDYAFPSVVRLDAAGALLSFDYYYVTYQRFDECPVKSMEQAYHALPLAPVAGQTEIRLTKCNLVYVYKDSFLQPAYLFEGVLDGGKYFKCFVDAAVYGVD